MKARYAGPIAWRWAAAPALAALLCGALAASPAFAADLPPGLRLPGLRGGELTTRELEGGSHVLVVWASWSPRCRDIVDRIQAIEGKYGQRARVASIDFQEDPATVEEFLRGKSLRAPVYLDRDGEFSKSLEVTTLPGLVVVRDGEVRYQGKLPSDLDRVLGELLR
jgi:thiol-disulfide isomerase/thioredoxin